MEPPKKLVKVATWYNDGTPQGRWQWEPGHEPREPLWKPLLVLALTLGALFLTLRFAAGNEPSRFQVVNKMPPRFEVANKLPAAPATVAPSAPAAPEGFRDNWPGVGIVEYRGGVWRAVPPTPSQYHQPAAPAVAAPRPFRAGPVHHAGHNCPVCGRAQYIQSGPGPVRGSHTHTCAAGHSWWH